MEITDYRPIMYAETQSDLLRTGDIIKLDLDDFKTIVRHESILPLLKQFNDEPAYVSKYWALLNQPCDMVHDPDKGRHLRSNLFLSPLQGLRSALRKGALGDLVHFESVKMPENVFTETYKTYLTDKAKRENPKPEAEAAKDYYPRLNRQFVEPAVSRIENDLAPVKGQFKDPNDVISTLKEYLKSDTNLTQSLNELEATEIWQKAIEKYQKEKEEAEKRNNSLTLKADAKDKLAALALNQLDSQGVFFYEPHARISKSDIDLSYVVLMQDMLTLKIDKEALSSGHLYDLLKKNRVLSLTENFSDRLLNIMGNYFSKIGTGDVRSDRIIELYTNTYRGQFFASEDQYKNFHKKTTAQPEAPPPK